MTNCCRLSRHALRAPNPSQGTARPGRVLYDDIGIELDFRAPEQWRIFRVKRSAVWSVGGHSRMDARKGLAGSDYVTNVTT